MFRRSFPALVCVLTAVLALPSCGPSKQEFGSLEQGTSGGERYRSGLEVPPDLVDTSSDTIVANRAEQESQPRQVLPEIEDLRVERSDEEGWLEVNADADVVWRRLVDHWHSLGVTLVEANSTTGTMETDWVLPPGADEDASRGMFADVLGQLLPKVFDQATALDKYTLQLERKDGPRTRINVSHRGLKKVQTQQATKQYNEEYEWVETDEQPAKIRRVLTSLAYGLQGETS